MQKKKKREGGENLLTALHMYYVLIEVRNHFLPLTRAVLCIVLQQIRILHSD